MELSAVIGMTSRDDNLVVSFVVVAEALFTAELRLLPLITAYTVYCVLLFRLLKVKSFCSAGSNSAAGSELCIHIGI